MRYWIEFTLKRAYVELPDELTEEELDIALEKAMEAVDLDALVDGWDAGEGR